jgi:hypothetical protein
MSKSTEPAQPLPKVVLHVGSPKTGSSYIQSALVLSRQTLAAAGIHYPQHASDAAAAEGAVTSGNIDAFVEKDVRDVILGDLEVAPSATKTILYSNEMLTKVLSENPQVVRDILAVTSVEVVAFVRDPVEWFWSTYGQHVKGKGLTVELNDFMPRWKPPQLALDFFTVCDELGVGLTVRNYSTTKHDLLPVFSHMLAPLADITLTTPAQKTVNRSLTVSEEAFQREVNRTSFRNPEALADALVNQLPDIQVPPRPMTANVIELLKQNFSPVFTELNRYLPEEEALVFAPMHELDRDSTSDLGDSAAVYSFTQDQIEVIVATLVSPPIPEPSSVSSGANYDSLVSRISELQAEVDALRASRSWRFTRFLRRTQK